MTPRQAQDPTTIGKSALVLAVISLLIFGYGLSLMATIFGGIGTYLAIKKKSGVKIILLNIAAILLGLLSRVLFEMWVR